MVGLLFLKGTGLAVDAGEKGTGAGNLGVVEGGEVMFRMHCMREFLKREKIDKYTMNTSIMINFL